MMSSEVFMADDIAKRLELSIAQEHAELLGRATNEELQQALRAPIWRLLVLREVERAELEALERVRDIERLPLESPIEKLFLAAFLWDLLNWRIVEIRDGMEHWVAVNSTPDPVHMVIIPQAQIGSFRVDFLVRAYTELIAGRPQVAQMVIECDGHDFHERTKQQARKDRSRDRLLQQQGFLIFRFTGSELWENPIRCASEAYRALWKAAGEGAERLSAQIRHHP